MAIRKPDPARTVYQGSAQSLGFNPLKIQDTSRQESAAARQRVDDEKYAQRALTRQQNLDSGLLKAQQNIANAHFAKEKASMAAQQATIKGVISLLGSANKLVGQFAQFEQEAEIQRNTDRKIDQQWEAMTGGGQTQAEVEKDAETETIVRAESQAIGSVTAGLEAEGSATSVSAANTLQQQSPAMALNNIKGNAYKGRAAYAPFLQAAWEATPQEARPTSAAGIDAWATARTKEFMQAAELQDLPKKYAVEILGGTMIQAKAQFTQAAVANHLKVTRQANLDTVNSQNSLLMRNKGMSAGERMQGIISNMRDGNIGYHGNSEALNRAALTYALEQAKAEGDVDFIIDLYDDLKIPGQKGTEWGRQYDHMFSDALKGARQAGVSAWTLKSNEAKVQIGQIQEQVLGGSIGRAQAIQELQAINHPAADQMARVMLSQGMNYDPDAKFDIAERAASGNPYTYEELLGLRNKGTITPEEFTNATKGMPEPAHQQLVENKLKPIKKGLESYALGGVGKGDLSPEAASQLNYRMDMAYNDIQEKLLYEVGANPQLMTNPALLDKKVLEIQQQVLSQPQYTIDRDKPGAYNFKADIPAPTNSKFTTVAPGIEDFSKLEYKDVKALEGKPNITLDPGKDRFYSNEDLRHVTKQALAGKPLDYRTKKLAEAMGLSPTAFIEAQLSRAGLPSLSFMRKVEAEKSAPTLQPAKVAPGQVPPRGSAQRPTLRQGFEILQSMGVPDRGAAYLTGNIMQESGWWGMRTWGEVLNDGSDRNGGLVSWMDDAQRNHFRLRNIEKHLGKPITEASNAEQLAAMFWEMKRRNPQAYRTFMNPHASDRELRKASRAYWGYGHEGARYKYASDILAGNY